MRPLTWIIAVLTTIMLIVGIIIGGVTLYKDTHCGLILGTEVCRGGSWSSPSPSPSSSTILITWHRIAGTDNWWTSLDCTRFQCTTYPGAGPDGSTCYPGGRTDWCTR